MDQLARLASGVRGLSVRLDTFRWELISYLFSQADVLQIQNLLANAPRENSTYRQPAISQEGNRSSQEMHLVPVTREAPPPQRILPPQDSQRILPPQDSQRIPPPPPTSAADLHRATTSELSREPLGFHGPAPGQPEETFSVAAFVREMAR